MTYPQYGGEPVAATTPEERNWALAAHVGSIVTAWVALGLVAPLIVLLLKGNDSPYIRRHAVESLNFQINALVWTVLCYVLMFVLVGFVLIVVYGFFWLICVVVATVRASQGGEFRYPLTVRIIS
ncbi:DUF4870 domain-containing protein [Pseudonocardia sp. CA-107938]|uniref:DUF4870 domain-containing protein n=1 Tax=Pseudonocardia sp. CA-107938 TaxID=3240021 RepID=UPI003D8D1113